MKKPARKNKDKLPPAPELAPELAESPPISDVYFAEEHMHEVLTEYYGKEETDRVRKRIYGDSTKPCSQTHIISPLICSITI